jgi:amidohydrolase
MASLPNSIVEQVRCLAEDYAPRLGEVRRYLHRRPELSGAEYATTEILAEVVRDLGLSPTLAGDDRGLCVDFGSETASSRIAIRGDIDALPIQTELDAEYASRVDQTMHACGHDAHSAILWGAIAILNDLSLNQASTHFIPSVRAIFQPEEETSLGGLHMIEAGALEGVSAAIALHVDPSRPVGTIGVRDGGFTAGCDSFTCEIQGDGGHGARPHLTSDTVGAAAQWVTDIYRRVPRATDARDAVVINVGRFQSGVAPNVVPATAVLSGTIRTLTPASADAGKAMMRSISDSIAEVHRCCVNLSFGQYTPPVQNDVLINHHVRAAAKALLGADLVHEIQQPSMGAEDFSFTAQKVPAAMFRLGVAGSDIGNEPLHTPKFDLDEDALAVGASVLAMTAIHWNTSSSS